MKRKTSIYLDPVRERALARYATRKGISKAEAIRRAIDEIVAGSEERPRITAIGVAEGPGDVADNMERYLLEGDFGRD